MFRDLASSPSLISATLCISALSSFSVDWLLCSLSVGRSVGPQLPHLQVTVFIALLKCFGHLFIPVLDSQGEMDWSSLG